LNFTDVQIHTQTAYFSTILNHKPGILVTLSPTCPTITLIVEILAFLVSFLGVEAMKRFFVVTDGKTFTPGRNDGKERERNRA
jgi:hypothetical protein